MSRYSPTWKSSKQPRKQRKYLANAPLHARNKMMSCNLSKELRQKHGMRNITLRKGDTVKILRGQFKSKGGKVERVSTKHSKAYVTGIELIKKDGSKALLPITVSNLQITELNTDDKKRIKVKKEIKNDKKSS